MSKKRKNLAENLKEKINQLEKNDMESIGQILKKNKANITENMNGIYFDLLTLKPDVFKTIEKFVDQCIERKKMMNNINSNPI